MIFCVRATLGLRRPLIGIMARLGVPVGGRVTRLRAVEGQSAPIPEEEAASEGEWEVSGQVPFLLAVKASSLIIFPYQIKVTYCIISAGRYANQSTSR